MRKQEHLFPKLSQSQEGLHQGLTRHDTHILAEYWRHIKFFENNHFFSFAWVDCWCFARGMKHLHWFSEDRPFGRTPRQTGKLQPESNKEIGNRLRISERTVKFHLTKPICSTNSVCEAVTR
jgi:hypothetical protein